MLVSNSTTLGLLVASISIAGALLSSCALLRGPSDTDQHSLEMAMSYSAQNAGDALLVWKDDTLLIEDYQNGYHPDSIDTRHPLTDGSAMLWGLVALAAVNDNLLSLEAPVPESFPTWTSSSGKSEITVSELLHGTSGLETSLRGVPSYENALNKPLFHPPGEGFRYGSTGFQVFAYLVQHVTGLDYLKERILNPIGIAGGYWSHTDGTLNAAYGSHLTAQEWGRIGQLILQDGTWNSRTIISNLLSRLTQPTEASPGFGLGVWLNTPIEPGHPFYNHLPIHYGRFPFVLTPDGPNGLIYADGPSDLFMAAGGSGQRLYVIPSHDMVVVRLGRADPTWNDAEFLARLLDGRAYSVTDK